jgi:hypothetical protein
MASFSRLIRRGASKARGWGSSCTRFRASCDRRRPCPRPQVVRNCHFPTRRRAAVRQLPAQTWHRSADYGPPGPRVRGTLVGQTVGQRASTVPNIGGHAHAPDATLARIPKQRSAVIRKRSRQDAASCRVVSKHCAPRSPGATDIPDNPQTNRPARARLATSVHELLRLKPLNTFSSVLCPAGLFGEIVSGCASWAASHPDPALRRSATRPWQTCSAPPRVLRPRYEFIDMPMKRDDSVWDGRSRRAS